MTYRLVILPKAIAQAAKIHAHYSTIKPDSLPEELGAEIRENLRWQEEGWGRLKATAQNRQQQLGYRDLVRYEAEDLYTAFEGGGQEEGAIGRRRRGGGSGLGVKGA
jgi:hypothetical protein